MAERFTFTVPGDPAAWMRSGDKPGGGHYDPTRNSDAKEEVGWNAALAMREARLPIPRDDYKGPITLRCDFFMRRGKTVTRDTPTVKSDLDNYLKLIMDALNHIAYHDDAQVVTSITRKRYAAGEPETVVTVTYAATDPSDSGIRIWGGSAYNALQIRLGEGPLPSSSTWPRKKGKPRRMMATVEYLSDDELRQLIAACQAFLDNVASDDSTEHDRP